MTYTDPTTSLTVNNQNQEDWKKKRGYMPFLFCVATLGVAFFYTATGAGPASGSLLRGYNDTMYEWYRYDASKNTTHRVGDPFRSSDRDGQLIDGPLGNTTKHNDDRGFYVIRKED
mmetsp:Transcript_25069/g.28071  ORF Transcript_25069/g.28071 Transcript_25069/m.28071 type:complete len:116 (+) Transcript_25069:135-482(+)